MRLTLAFHPRRCSRIHKRRYPYRGFTSPLPPDRCEASRCGPASASIDTSCAQRQQACARRVRCSRTSPQRTRHRALRLQAPPVFSDYRLQRVFVQAQVGNHRLQTPVLLLKLPQTLRVADFHSAVFHFQLYSVWSDTPSSRATSFEGHRVDDQVQQTVAIKFLDLAIADEDVRAVAAARFLQ